MPPQSTPVLGRVLTTIALKWDKEAALGYYRLYHKKRGFSGWYIYMTKVYDNDGTEVPIANISPRVFSDLGGGTPLLSLLKAGGQLIDEAKTAGTGNIGGHSPADDKVKGAAAQTDGMVEEWLKNWNDGAKNKTYKELEKKLDSFYAQGYRFAPNISAEKANKIIWSADWNAFTGTAVLLPNQTAADLTVARDSTYRSPSPQPQPRAGPASPRAVSASAGGNRGGRYPGIGEVMGRGNARASGSGSGSSGGAVVEERGTMIDVSKVKFGKEILDFAGQDEWKGSVLMQFAEFLSDHENESFFLHKEYLAKQDAHALAYIPETLLRTKEDKDNAKEVEVSRKKIEELENSLVEAKEKLATAKEVNKRLRAEAAKLKAKKGVIEAVKDAAKKTAEAFGTRGKISVKRKRGAEDADEAEDREIDVSDDGDAAAEQEEPKAAPRKRTKRQSAVTAAPTPDAVDGKEDEDGAQNAGGKNGGAGARIVGKGKGKARARA